LISQNVAVLKQNQKIMEAFEKWIAENTNHKFNNGKIELFMYKGGSYTKDELFEIFKVNPLAENTKEDFNRLFDLNLRS